MNVLLFLGSFQIMVLTVTTSSLFDPLLTEGWENWKMLHQKQYTENDERGRRMVWEKNLWFVEYHNQEYLMGKHTYNLKMNQFGDMGACGSCWAFSSTGALEGQTFKKTGKLIPLSEQNLVDCSGPQGNQGCGGGWMENAFLYVHDNNGIDSEAGYPYTGRDDSCNYTVKYKATNCTNYFFVTKGNENALARAAARIGPISVAIDASHQSFQFYHSGIYYEPNCLPYIMSHAVLVVGYGTTSGLNYWIVKNSYGVEWGNEGYILMSRGRQNNCGIATHAVYPVV
ncbi:procathepsin L-like isoform X2 [Scyliorhinus torazame]|uniref:procathepsin L-like isoform X2 n=1 Tax=Scyliorhinus torazame TaxID=75743 RepID=UPI003B5A33E2